MKNEVLHATIYYGDREFLRFTGENSHFEKAIQTCIGDEDSSRIQISLSSGIPTSIRLLFSAESDKTVVIVLHPIKDNKRGYTMWFQNREVFGIDVIFPEFMHDFAWQFYLKNSAGGDVYYESSRMNLLDKEG